VKPKLKPPGTKRLTLEYDGLVSKFAFVFNLRRYTKRVRNTARRHKLVQLRQTVDELLKEEDFDDRQRATDQDNLEAVGLGGSPSCHGLCHSSDLGFRVWCLGFNA
jgi:hypothetical protein